MTDQPQPQPGVPGNSGAWQPVPGGGDYDPDQTMHVSFAAQLPPEPRPGEDPLGAHGPSGPVPPVDVDAATTWTIPVIRDDADGDSGEFSVGAFTSSWDQAPSPAAPTTQSFPAGMFGQGAAAASAARAQARSADRRPDDPSEAAEAVRDAAGPGADAGHYTGAWPVPFAGPEGGAAVPWLPSGAPATDAAWSGIVDEPEGPPPAAQAAAAPGYPADPLGGFGDGAAGGGGPYAGGGTHAPAADGQDERPSALGGQGLAPHPTADAGHAGPYAGGLADAVGAEGPAGQPSSGDGDPYSAHSGPTADGPDGAGSGAGATDGAEGSGLRGAEGSGLRGDDGHAAGHAPDFAPSPDRLAPDHDGAPDGDGSTADGAPGAEHPQDTFAADDAVRPVDGADPEAAAAGPPEAAEETRSEHPLASYMLRVNSTDRPVTDAWLGESLLYVLRERLGLAGAKDGCEQGECGACSVQVDGRLVASCLVPAATAAGSEVRTVEGLTVDGRPSDVQRALADCGAVQCGFCIPGMAMTVHDLLEGNHRPTDLDIRQALSGNLCRCSGYRGVIDAVRQVAADRGTDGGHSDESARVPQQGGAGAPEAAV
jgi:aerobic-type carbon monoxide dehydrogenase small subunit (CoxS/CutS family)